jgi:hypothetical protein
MIVPRKSIFRDKALKYYAQGKKKDVLPNFSSIPVAIFLWVLVAALIATGLLAYYAQVPVYIAGPGLVLGAGNHILPGSNEAFAVGFFSPDNASHLQAGQAVQVQISTSGQQLNSTVAKVEPGTNNPATVLEHYGINISSSSLADQPEVVVFVSLGTSFPVALYSDNALALEVKTGSQSLFSALTGLGN